MTRIINFSAFRLRSAPVTVDFGGDHWVVSGPAGGGKTTLLGILDGRIVSQTGTVEYPFGTVDDTLEWFETRRRRILSIQAGPSTIFDQQDQYYQQRYYQLGDELTPTVRTWLGQETIDNLPRTFRVSALLDQPVTTLSNGQLKKAMMVRHLGVMKPALLLWDFPFEGLDRASRRDLCEFLDHLVAETGVQLILVDHGNELPSCITRRLYVESGMCWEVPLGLPVVSAEAHLSGIGLQQGEVIVRMNHVRIQYGSRVVLDGLDWTIRCGERWALTGPNGSGKTTLFSLIFADHPFAYSNDIWLFGRKRGSGESIWDIKSKVGYIGPEVLRFMTPREKTVLVGEWLISTSASEKDVNAALEFFSVSHLRQRQLRQLSSGEYQIIALITFFLKPYELYLLDEPFQFLDPAQKQRLSHYMQSHLPATATLVMISHHEDDLLHWTQQRKVLGAQ